jgi:hypothetical protein
MMQESVIWKTRKRKQRTPHSDACATGVRDKMCSRCRRLAYMVKYNAEAANKERSREKRAQKRAIESDGRLGRPRGTEERLSDRKCRECGHPLPFSRYFRHPECDEDVRDFSGEIQWGCG